MKSTSVLRENRSDQLNIVTCTRERSSAAVSTARGGARTVDGLLVSPIHHHGGGSDNSRHVHHDVRLSCREYERQCKQGAERAKDEPIHR